MIDPAMKLARMANQIAIFFRSYPEEAGIEGVRAHIKSFWTPRMRQDLAARLGDPNLTLDPLVIAAFEADPKLVARRLSGDSR